MASRFNDVGQVCSQLGIDTSSLLSYLSSTIKQLPEVQITNGLILELLRFKDQHSQCTFKVLYLWVRDLYGKAWPSESPPTSKAITKSIRRLMEVYQKLKKSCESTKVAEFLQQEYILPKLGIYKGKVIHFSPAKKSKETKPASRSSCFTAIMVKIHSTVNLESCLIWFIFTAVPSVSESWPGILIKQSGLKWCPSTKHCPDMIWHVWTNASFVLTCLKWKSHAQTT